MKVCFRIVDLLACTVRKDLARPHPVAAERVGFLFASVADLRDGGLLALAHSYLPIPDEHYLNDDRVAAMLGAGGFRLALQRAYQRACSVWHVHCHEHPGEPGFSITDQRENASFVPDFFNVRPTFPHGALVLSRDSLAGLCWVPNQPSPHRVACTIVRSPMAFSSRRQS